MKNPFRRTVLILGDLSHADFADVVSWLANSCNVLYSLDEAKPAKDSIDYVVFFQSRPGQIPQQAIEQVHRTWPLAKLAMVLGSWCEGETRSGRPCHGVERMFWYEAKQLLPGRIASGSRNIPVRTLSPLEAVERIAQLQRLAFEGRRATVVARSRSAFSPLSDALQQLGFGVVWTRSLNAVASETDVILWDADDLGITGDAEPDVQVSALSIPMIACMNFPRRSEVERLKTWGCREVLGKPISLAVLERVLGLMVSPGVVRTSVA